MPSSNLSSYLLIALLGLVVFPFSSCQKRLDRDLAKTRSSYDYKDFLGNSELVNYSYADLRKDYESNRWTKIEDLLTYLSLKFPSVRDRVAFVYRSRSLQGATPDNPRMIYFGSRKFALAVNGSSDLVGGDRIEILDFETDGTIKPREIIQVANTLQFDDHPTSCAACHGVEAKPIFDTYLVWPGFFGSEDDRTFQGKNFEAYRFKEYDYVSTFLTTYKSNPRYKHFSYEMDLNYYGTKDFRNERLNILLSYVNNRRIIKQIESSKSAALFKPLAKDLALLKAKVGNQFEYKSVDLIKLLGDKAPTTDPNLFASFLAATWSTIQTSNDTKYQRYAKFGSFDPSNFIWVSLAQNQPQVRLGAFDVLETFTSKVSQLRFLAALTGESIANWPMVFSANAFAFATPANGINDLLDEFIREWGTQESNTPVSSISEVRINFVTSLMQPKQGPLSELDKQPVLTRCMACHVDASINSKLLNLYGLTGQAPVIPFDDVAQFKRWLLDSNGKNTAILNERIEAHNVATRMPPSPMGELTHQERDALKSYVQAAREF
jgi:hypothetical protein